MARVFAMSTFGITGRSEPKNIDAQRRSVSTLEDQRSSISHPIQIRRKSSRMVLSECFAAWQSAEGVSISEKIQEIYGNCFMQHLTPQFMCSTETLRTEGQRIPGEGLWPPCARMQTNTIPVKKFPISSTNADVVQRAGKTFRMIDDATLLEYLKTFSKYIPKLNFLNLFKIYCNFDEHDTNYIGQIEALNAFMSEFNIFYCSEKSLGDQQIGRYKKIVMLNYLKEFFDRGYDQEMKVIKAQMSKMFYPRLFSLVKMLDAYSIQFSSLLESESELNYDIYYVKLAEIYGSLNAFISGLHILTNYSNKQKNDSIINSLTGFAPSELFSQVKGLLMTADSCRRILQQIEDGGNDIYGFFGHVGNIISSLEAILIVLQEKKFNGPLKHDAAEFKAMPMRTREHCLLQSDKTGKDMNLEAQDSEPDNKQDDIPDEKNPFEKLSMPYAFFSKPFFSEPSPKARSPAGSSNRTSIKPLVMGREYTHLSAGNRLPSLVPLFASSSLDQKRGRYFHPKVDSHKAFFRGSKSPIFSDREQIRSPNLGQNTAGSMAKSFREPAREMVSHLKQDLLFQEPSDNSQSQMGSDHSKHHKKYSSFHSPRMLFEHVPGKRRSASDLVSPASSSLFFNPLEKQDYHFSKKKDSRNPGQLPNLILGHDATGSDNPCGPDEDEKVLASSGPEQMSANNKYKAEQFYGRNMFENRLLRESDARQPAELVTKNVMEIRKRIQGNEQEQRITTLLSDKRDLNKLLDDGDFDSLILKLTVISSLDQLADDEKHVDQKYAQAAKALIEIVSTYCS